MKNQCQAYRLIASVNSVRNEVIAAVEVRCLNNAVTTNIRFNNATGAREYIDVCRDCSDLDAELAYIDTYIDVSH